MKLPQLTISESGKAYEIIDLYQDEPRATRTHIPAAETEIKRLLLLDYLKEAKPEQLAKFREVCGILGGTDGAERAFLLQASAEQIRLLFTARNIIKDRSVSDNGKEEL